MEACTPGAQGRALPYSRLSLWERRGLYILAAAFIIFGALFEMRSALLQNRKGDLNVFLRAAWAVRAGEDIYQATDDNDHHYHYPPFLAVMLVPLADPPQGRAPLPGTLPYAVSVALWYALSIGLLFLALDMLAGALEEKMYRGARPALGDRRWWALRVLPLLACLPAIGGALMRGQVDFLLLALFCGMMAAILRGQSGRAGLLLSAAISIKVIPAFLLIYPVWKRDTRWLASCAAGLVVCLGIVPAAAFGPKQAVAYYYEWNEVLLKPGLTDHGDQTRADELTQVTATDSQSYLAMIHNIRNPGIPRPPNATSAERLAHWIIAAVLTVLTLAAVGRRADRGPIDTTVFIGMLMVMMILSSPICHLHYFSMCTPLAMALVAARWQEHGSQPLLNQWVVAIFALNFITSAVPRIPGFEPTRDFGLATCGALTLWFAGCLALRKSPALLILPGTADQPRQPNMAA
jgi:hypothetical protein